MQAESCKRELDITVAVDEIERETEKVVSGLQQKVRLPGFRPGRAPAGLIRSKFAREVRQDVLEALIPRHLQQRFEQDHLHVVGTPSISDVHFESGEPLRFKAEFEVAPEIELNEYRGLSVVYNEPQVSPEDVEKRIGQIREQKAEYVNVEPRPVEDGDYAVVSLESVSGVAEPVKQDEMTLHAGDTDTMPEFTEALRGMNPGDEKEFDVTYPADYGQENLAGKSVRFRLTLKGIRRKELPELNDEFAQDLGDYRTLDDLREAVRQAIFREREMAAQSAAKGRLVDKLVDSHEFPVPEAYLDRQIEIQVESQLRQLTGRAVDPHQLKLDWARVKESQRPKALRDVKASLLLDKVATRENIDATRDEVDHEVQRIARQEREPVAAVRKKLEKDGTLGRIANHIRTEKTLNFLFEHARKEAGTEPEEERAPE